MDEHLYAQHLLSKGKECLREGRPHDAIHAFHDAFAEFVNWRNQAGAIDALAERTAVYEHLHRETGERAYAILMAGSAQVVLQLVDECGIAEKQATAHYLYAQALAVWKGPDGASEAQGHMRLALELFCGSETERMVWELQARYLAALGKGSNCERADLRAIREILQTLELRKRAVQEDSEDRLLLEEWISSGYMKLAELLTKCDDPAASECMERARQIVYDNESLSLKRRQWNRMAIRLAAQMM